MIRAIALFAVLVGAFVWLLIYMTSPMREQVDARDKMASGDLSPFKKPGGGPRRASRGQRRPLSAEHKLLQIIYADDHPAATLGGVIIAELRGDGIVYRRPSMGDPSMERHIISARTVDAVLRDVSELPGDAVESGLRMGINVGDALRWKQVSQDQVLALLEKLGGRGRPWTPKAVIVQVAATGEAPDGQPPDWPDLEGLGAPSDYETAAEFRASSRIMKPLLEALREHHRFTHNGRAYRLVRWSPVMPP